ncbi:MAG: TolC family protein [Bacteroidota bacterium]
MKAIPFFISIFFASSILAQEVLTVEDAIRQGLLNNYDIKIARVSEEIGINDATIGNAGLLPTVDLQGQQNWASQNVNQQFFNGNENIRDGARSQNLNGSANFTWTLFNGLGMFYTLDRLNVLREANAFNTKVTMENAIADLLTAYYTVVLENERLKVLDNTIQLSERRTEIAKNKYDVGKSSKVEYLAAQVDQNADITLRLQVIERLNNAKIDLNRLMARDLNSQFEVSNLIDINGEFQLEALLNSANLKNASLLLAQRNLNANYLQIQEIRAERYPRIDFFSSYTYSKSTSEAGFLESNRQDGYNYGFRATVNVFDGFNTNRRSQNAKLSAQIGELEIKNQTLNIDSDISKVFTSYRNSLNLIDLESQNLDVALENEEIALERYRLGNSTALELREAQTNAVEVESRLLNARYSTKISEIELLRLSGSLIQPAASE